MNKFYFYGARWFLKSRERPIARCLRCRFEETTREEITMAMLIGDDEASYCNLQMYFMVQQVILSHNILRPIKLDVVKENRKNNLHFYDVWTVGPVLVRLLAHRFPESTIILYLPGEWPCLQTFIRKWKGHKQKFSRNWKPFELRSNMKFALNFFLMCYRRLDTLIYR